MNEQARNAATHARAEEQITDQFLQYLADDGDSALLRELAADVRQGTITLADGIAFPAYADELAPKVTAFARWYQSLTEQERRREAAACASQVAKLEAELTADDQRSGPQSGPAL